MRSPSIEPRRARTGAAGSWLRRGSSSTPSTGRCSTPTGRGQRSSPCGRRSDDRAGPHVPAEGQLMRRLAYLLSLALVFSVPWEAGIQFHALGTGAKLLGFVASAVWLVSLLGRGRVRAFDQFHHVYFLF